MITQPNDVEIALRRAQTAVLNPKTASAQFVTMRVDELKKARPNQLLFSRNAVCVDLSGPQLADLAFVDLPGKLYSVCTRYQVLTLLSLGIVQYADDSIVKLVEDLVKSHISRDKGNCLILVTLPMSGRHLLNIAITLSDSVFYQTI